MIWHIVADSASSNRAWCNLAAAFRTDWLSWYAVLKATYLEGKHPVLLKRVKNLSKINLPAWHIRISDFCTRPVEPFNCLFRCRQMTLIDKVEQIRDVTPVPSRVRNSVKTKPRVEEVGGQVDLKLIR